MMSVTRAQKKQAIGNEARMRKIGWPGTRTVGPVVALFIG
jgi:hypothetical protein